MGAYGSGPPPMTVQPSSLPGASVPNSSFPVRGFLPGPYTLRAAATCGAVKQSAASPVLHNNTLGSNLQRVGSEINPSLSPSAASHAVRAARWISAYFAGGMWLAGSLRSACAIQSPIAVRFPGAPYARALIDPIRFDSNSAMAFSCWRI